MQRVATNEKEENCIVEKKYRIETKEKVEKDKKNQNDTKEEKIVTRNRMKIEK